ncbi:hypothetical protein CWC16_19465, partial [Pseudoalteromonas sp. S3776]
MLSQRPSITLAALSKSLCTGRPSLPVSICFIARSIDDTCEQLVQKLPLSDISHKQAKVLLANGFNVDTSKQLADAFPSFRECLEEFPLNREQALKRWLLRFDITAT